MMNKEVFEIGRIAQLLWVVFLLLSFYAGMTIPFRSDAVIALPQWLNVVICIVPFLIFTLPAKFGKNLSPFDVFWGSENSFLRRLFTIVPPLKLMGVCALLSSVVGFFAGTMFGKLPNLGAEFLVGLSSGVACFWAHLIYVKRGVRGA
jgi:hypothetical protein